MSSKRQTLYELTGEYEELIGALECAESEEEADEIWRRLGDTEDGIQDKAEAYARILRNKQAEADALKTEKRRLEQRLRAAEAVVERLKARMLEIMQWLGVREVPTGIGKWRVQMNPYSVSVLDEAAVPDEFRIPQPDKIDKEGILKHYKETGEILDGTSVAQSLGIRFR